ncbi:MAG: GNAT family N-acetyltransferase [Bacteroidetes bacterium]|nr:GNAT family N-acetyltransferase [Bacteroidota bacterium]
MLAGDVESLALLYKEFWGEASNRTRMVAKFDDLKDNPAYIFLSAVDGKRVVGSIMGIICEELYGECEPFMVMEDFVVSADYRRTGVGRRLMEALEQAARNKGCRQIQFMTEAGREDSIAFYASQGYDPSRLIGFKKKL